MKDQRGRGLTTRRFKLPARCSVGEIVMRELDGRDDIEIAIRTKQKLNSATEDNPAAIMAIQQNEAYRAALVEVDGEAVPVDGPYVAMDRWTQRTMTFVGRAFNALNGVQGDELKEFLAEDKGDAPASDEDPAAP